ncbi:MAG TPA: DUF2970 domain-containing protein [Rubrivivax sp.]|jgi:hypothetical protein|nr:DUF2970 domain-containing protein [Rubrivivax sp.]
MSDTLARVGRAAKAVAWSFFGVRRRAELEADAQRLRPHHLIIGGVAGAALFVLALLMLARWIAASAGA